MVLPYYVRFADLVRKPERKKESYTILRRKIKSFRGFLMRSEHCIRKVWPGLNKDVPVNT